MARTDRYKHEPFTDGWEKAADRVARNYAPEAYPCGKCGYPVLRGYCCTRCGDSNPDETPEQEEAWNKKYGVS